MVSLGAGAGADATHRRRHAYLVAGLAWMTAHAVGLLGPMAEVTFVVIGLLSMAAVVTGLRINGVRRKLPWRLMLAAMLVWILGGGVRLSFETLGDLSSNRSLIPDAFSLAGYALFGVGLMLLQHQRYRDRGRNINAALDATIASVAIASIFWIAFLAPALDADTDPLLELLLISYPMLSIWITVIALRFAFSTERTSVPWNRFLVLSLVLLVLGDGVYMLLELDLVHVPQRVIDLPYGLAFLLFGGSVLHPSVREADEPLRIDPDGARRVRLISVGLALGVPAAITGLGAPANARDRLVIFVLAIILTAAATTRVTRAMHAQNAVQRRLSHAASHDSLTDLPNRAHLTEHLRGLRVNDGTSHFGALFADIDRFKLINDGMGHATGDALLRAVARRLSDNVNDNDFVARVGGDEFVIITSAVTAVEIQDLAERLRCSLGVPFRANGNLIHASMSVGARILPPGAAIEFDTILEDADSALYQAKTRGRNTVVVFDPSMREWADEQLFLEQELNDALVLGQMHVEYQPIVRLPDGAIEGFEALTRWNHPVMGAIGPETFIPVAEETGMILDIGAWVLDEACRQLREWRESGVVDQVTMSVNLSPRQLLEPSLVADVIATMERHEVAHGALQLEITEGLLMSDPRSAKRQLIDLRDAGVRVSLDDFGTGYSSIAQLKSFPVDSAKIDRSFVSGIGYSEPSSDDSLVAAIVAMSGALGFATIAEGVENAAQAARLFELGVRSAQGYFYARSLRAEAVPAALARLRQDQTRGVPPTSA